jgi:hypothetical protein
MGRKRRVDVKALVLGKDAQHPLIGSRFIDILQRELDHLHRLPAHGNRELFFDQVVVAHLIAFFNPVLSGLRSIEDIFEQPEIQKRFGLPRIPKSTLADAQRVFDPDLLRPIIDVLRQRVSDTPHDARLDTLSRKILAVDATFFRVAPRIAWAIFNTAEKGSVRAHTQFDIVKAVPDAVSLTEGQASEARQLEASLRPGCLYIMDRGFEDYELLAGILTKGSDFVVRLRKSALTEPLEVRPLTPAACGAGIRCDNIVQIGWRKDRRPVDKPVRLVEVEFVTREGQPEVIRLLTNRIDIPAELVALLYQYRWQVELFFRWLKCMANFKHFFSESQSGMQMQIYVAIIGTLLMAVTTGSRPNKYDYALIAAAVSGLGNIEEALAVAEKRRAERARAAERQKARLATKKAAH